MRQMYNITGERCAFHRNEEMGIGHRQLECHAALEARREAGDEIAVEGIELDGFGAMNALSRELAQERLRRLVLVDGDARRRLGCLVQSRRTGRADVDPGAQLPGEIVYRERRLVG